MILFYCHDFLKLVLIIFIILYIFMIVKILFLRKSNRRLFWISIIDFNLKI